MNASTIGVIGLSALLLTACETLNGPQAVANADAQQEGCRNGVTVVTSTPEEMRLARPGSAQTDQMKEAEGKLALIGIKQNEPRVLRDNVAPEESLTSKSIRGC